MPDILKITTPLVNKPDQQINRPVQDPTTAFDLQNIQKVIKPDAQSGLLKQNNGMPENEGAPALLMNLLKDPDVTVGFLKNIFMLQEIIQLLPVNNSTLTPEIEQLFEALLVNPDNIAAEMQNQENTSTVFKGELFNFLRGLVNDPGQPPETARAVADLLKALNHFSGNHDILDAVANTLQFIGNSVDASKSLSERLLELSDRFRQSDAPENFGWLKSSVLSILKEVEDSLLFTPKLQKMVSITIYNLSRYNDNDDFLRESVSHLVTLLDNKERATFQEALKSFFLTGGREPGKDNGNIMDILAKILGRETNDESLNLMNAEKIERIIHSLLSSPCNFTPLLHYVVPVQYDMLRAFAEIWINPNGHEDEKREGSGAGKDIHMLIVFDVEGIGRFEAELYVRDQVIDFSLLCPPTYAGIYEEAMKTQLSAAVAGLDYRFGNVMVGKLERTRSLMDVFKSLPYKRTGVNVKI